MDFLLIQSGVCLSDLREYVNQLDGTGKSRIWLWNLIPHHSLNKCPAEYLPKKTLELRRDFSIISLEGVQDFSKVIHPLPLKKAGEVYL